MYVLYIHGSVAFGPFPTMLECREQARVWYRTDDAYEHADTNCDFAIVPLFSTVPDDPAILEVR